MKTTYALAAAFALLAIANPDSAADAAEADPRRILQSFVDDYVHDAFAAEVVFGFDVDGKRWHMRIERGETGFSGELLDGFPDDPILYWELSGETLQRLDAGMNGETATARARADDPYPLQTRATDGFPRYLINQDLQDFLERLRLHFWTRGRPEVFPLGEKHARQSHGGNIVGLVYTEGMRTMWYQIAPGQHVNKDPADQTNPSHSLLIVTRDKAHCRFDGKEPVIIEEGNAYLIPGGMSHECWNDFDQPMEAVLIMYGEGA